MTADVISWEGELWLYLLFNQQHQKTVSPNAKSFECIWNLHCHLLWAVFYFLFWSLNVLDGGNSRFHSNSSTHLSIKKNKTQLRPKSSPLFLDLFFSGRVWLRGLLDHHQKTLFQWLTSLVDVKTPSVSCFITLSSAGFLQVPIKTFPFCSHK